MANIENNQGNPIVSKIAGTITQLGLADFPLIVVCGKPDRSRIPGAPGNSITEDEEFPIGQKFYVFGGQADVDLPNNFWPDGSENETYRTLVLADEPDYYNTLSAPTAPLTPLAGAGNAVAQNGAVLNSPGLLSIGKSIQCDGTNDYIELPSLALSAYKFLLIQFLFYIDNDSALGTLAFAMTPSSNFDADGVAGDFIATFSGGDNKCFFAVKGNNDSTGSYSQKQCPQPSFGARNVGAFVIGNAGFLEVYFNGQSQTLSQLGAGAANTNNFLDGVIKLMGFGTSASTKGRISEVSVKGATTRAGLPSAARIQQYAEAVA